MDELELTILKMCKPEVMIQGEPPSFMGDETKPSAAFYAAERLRSGGFLEFIRDEELERSVYRITPKGRYALNELRGLSASEPPCCEAVINNPVDPTPGESNG